MGDDASEDQELAVLEAEHLEEVEGNLPAVIAGARSPDEELMFLGKAMASSGFFADSQRASQAIVKILAGRELGIPSVAAMTGIHIIKGRVSLSANLIAAIVKRSAKYNYRVVAHDRDRCVIEFSERGEAVGRSTFTMDDAKAAGLLATNPNWQRYPSNMLFARAMSNGAKWYCADIFGGPVYTGEELGADDESYDE